MTPRVLFRLARACVTANLSVWETVSVFHRVRRGSWVPRTNRELLAQANYLALLNKP